jgi:cytochrome c peroxidase
LLFTLGCTNELTSDEWKRIQSLANLPDPDPDRSNKYAVDKSAAHLGQELYFDPRFSGHATLVDALGRTVPYARAPKGENVDLSCASCHDPARGGSDHTSMPNQVSIGAGWYDVNGQPTRNAAEYEIIYWNMRIDSLWAQALAVAESAISMNGNRVHIARLIHDHYAPEYAAIFSDYPLPIEDSIDDLAMHLNPDGQCMDCTTPGCVMDVTGCYPRFPLDGKPGKKQGCQRGDASEPFGDAYDCMSPADQEAITRVLVNFAKAIAAYEYTLISRDSEFDRWVNEGQSSTRISPSAIRGAKLFVTKASCIDCHSGPLLSDGSDGGWHNVGVRQMGPTVPQVADCTAMGTCDCVNGVNCLPWGVYNGLALLKKNKFRRDSAWSDDPADDSRKEYYDIALTDEMKGSWRTPSLRDVALTAPYMHDGIYATLADVVHHYNIADVGPDVVGTPAVQLHPLLLEPEEEADLVAFLETLTGQSLTPEQVTAPALP